MGVYEERNRTIQKRVIGELGAQIPIFAPHKRFSDTLANVSIIQVLALEGKSRKTKICKSVAMFLANLPSGNRKLEADVSGIESTARLGIRIPDCTTIERHVDELVKRGYVKTVDDQKENESTRSGRELYNLTSRGYIAVQMLNGFRSNAANLIALYRNYDDIPLVDARAYTKLWTNCENLMSYIAQESLRRFPAHELELLHQSDIIPLYLEQFINFASSVYVRGLRGHLPNVASRGELERLGQLLKDQDVKSLLLDSSEKYIAYRQEETTLLSGFRKALS